MEGRVFSPRDLDGDERVPPLDDEIDLCAVACSLVEKLTVAEILEAPPKLDSYPLLEERPRIGAHDFDRGRDARSGMSQAEIEKKKPRSGEQAFSPAPLVRRYPETDEHVLEELIVGFHCRQRHADFLLEMDRDQSLQKLGPGRVLAKDQGIETVGKTATRKEVDPCPSEFSRRTPAKHESPPAFIRIVEALHGVEKRRDRLHLIHEDEVGPLARAEERGRWPQTPPAGTDEETSRRGRTPVWESSAPLRRPPVTSPPSASSLSVLRSGLYGIRG